MGPTDTQELFNRAAATYDRVAFPFFGPFGEALVDFAELGADERVLDVGCGAGAALAPASRIAGSVTGIELSPAMAERAREAAPSAEVVVGDARELPFEDGSFDVVLSSFVVFFMSDPTAALREWRRVIAPGGRMAIATWRTDADPRWSWERDVRMPYVRELGEEWIKEMQRAIGLLNRFDEPDKVKDELTAAGFEALEVVEHEIEFVFDSEDDWWDWSWSHGTRVFLEALSDEKLEGFRRDSYEAMQATRTNEGFPRTYSALFARAR